MTPAAGGCSVRSSERLPPCRLFHSFPGVRTHLSAMLCIPAFPCTTRVHDPLASALTCLSAHVASGVENPRF